MDLDLAYAKLRRPLTTVWGSALLIVGGVFFVLPLALTFLANLARTSAIDPRLVALLVVTAAAGAAQLLAARGVLRGDRWPRGFLLGLIAAEVTAVVFGFMFVVVGLILAGTAAGLLWGSGSRRYSADMLDVRRRR